ncbi:dUTP diphosphatase [Aerococcus urinaehominis]|uniref:dUTP diphosphatase n=1 Tax=Aerococcus urinaehominis TaxID=128944 RepID=A0A0X8FMC1_9LACT|nr:dUTP diphosphatase [Aerococcus urinaehominis]AMB99292.1 dUTP diphosphatase [Aerococcus urinaehominis]SDM19199.1 deoxyuridine 5'-triphosphate nucleotidohydrolase [Aerococcus urinaehominis]
MRRRGFEVITSYQDQGIELPKRATKRAAGYDIAAGETVTIPSIWSTVVSYVAKDWSMFKAAKNFKQAIKEEVMKPTLVPTGLKAYMGEEEYLQLTCRSSNPLKRFLTLPNGVGIIDSDYYNNKNNEGHIYVQLLNFGLRDITIQKGDRIAQGIFLNFLATDDDDTSTAQERSGGFGSSDES